MAGSTQTIIVVPCFNEADRLDTSSFDRFLGEEAGVDLIFVNDGSSDRTADVIDGLARRWPTRAQTLHLAENSGKAEAVRRGLCAAFDREGADFVGFWDADLATPLTSIPRFAEVLSRREELDIILGSRVKLLGRRIERDPLRHYLGRVFATAASLVLDLPVYDTQCGAKLFRAGPRTRLLFAEPFRSRWIFDVELLARHRAAGGDSAAIYELPVDRWRDVAGSKVRPSDFLRAIGELAEIHRRYNRHGLLSLLAAPFVRYTGVGALGTLVHFALLVVLVEALGLAAPLSAALGAVAGACVNYWLNYHFTFISRRRHRSTVSRFVIVAGLGVALNWSIVRLATETLGLHYILGQLAATAAVLVLGYALNRSWTFREDPNRHGPEGSEPPQDPS